MDLSSPISSVIPSAHGPVLVVLARTTQPLTGRAVARLTAGRVSQRRVNDVLRDLVQAGIVIQSVIPPAFAYTLNRDHVAAEGIEALARQRATLLSRIEALVGAWEVPAHAVWVFGSGARGDGATRSDVDLLVVRATSVHEDNPQWLAQLDDLASKVLLWSGNAGEVLELTPAELAEAHARGERLIRDLQRDALVIFGPSPLAMLGPARRPVQR